MNKLSRFNPNAPICPKCGSHVVYFRSKSNDYICRRCGYSGPRHKFFKPRSK